MYSVAVENRPICVESDAFSYNLGDPTLGTIAPKNIQSRMDLPWFIVHGVNA
jgi:hypothetical protein